MKDFKRKREILNEEKVLSPKTEREVTDREPEKAKIVNCILVNVRKEPDSDAEVLKTVKSGTECTLLDRVKGYCKIELIADAVTGYIPFKFLEVE